MYTINVLSNEAFEKLPYKHVKDALGCADAKTGQAYIRKTGVDGIDLLTIQHELEELVAKTSPHEVDGIRYKKGRDIISNVLPIAAAFIPGVGPLLSAGLAAGTSALSQKYIGSSGEINPWKVGLSGLGGYMGAGAAAPGQAAAKAGGAGFWGQAGAGLKSALLGAPTAAGGTAAGTSSIMPSGWSSMQLPAGSGAGGTAAYGMMGGAGTGASGMALSGNYGADMFGGMAGTGYGAGSTGMMSGTSGISGSTGVGSNMMSGTNAVTPQSAGNGFMQGIQKFAGNVGELINPMQMMGLGVMGMSSLPVMPTAPTLGPTISKWLSADTITKAGTKARSIMDSQYGGEFNSSAETLAYIDVLGADIDKQYVQRAKDMDRMGLASDQTWMNSGERLEMHRRLGEEKEQTKAKVSSELMYKERQDFANKQYEYVMNNLQVDEITKRELLYGELNDIIWKYQVEREDVLQFRQMAADAGMYMFQAGSDKA